VSYLSAERTQEEEREEYRLFGKCVGIQVLYKHLQCYFAHLINVELC